MNIYLDSERCKSWLVFAKRKLAQMIKSGVKARALIVNGYLIKLQGDKKASKIKIFAPPASVVIHAEDGLRLYYGEPIFATAYRAAQLGPANEDWAADRVYSDEGNFVSGRYRYLHNVTPTSGGGTEPGFHGWGVIWPEPGDAYWVGINPFITVNAEWTGDADQLWNALLCQRHYANYAPKNIGQSDYLAGGAITGVDTVGVDSFAKTLSGHQIKIGNLIFSAVGRGALWNSGNMQVLVHYSGSRHEYLIVDLNTAPLRGQLTSSGVPLLYLNTHAFYIYASPVAGKARLALCCGPAFGDSFDTDHMEGVYFVDVEFITPSDYDSADSESPQPYINSEYIGRCVVPAARGVSNAFGDFVGQDPRLVMTFDGIAQMYDFQHHKSQMFPDGAGGVYAMVYHPHNSSFPMTTFHAAPGVEMSASDAFDFPPDVTDWKAWPLIYRGTNEYLCVMERVEAGDCRAQSIWYGSPLAWIPLATDGLSELDTILAVRPVRVQNANIILVALVHWTDGETGGTYFADYNQYRHSIADPQPSWIKYGKVSESKLVRPLVGFFGNHPYTKYANDLHCSFPVQGWVGDETFEGV